MNAQLLIDSLVRQFVVLIAQIATTGGLRTPVAHIANEVFLELANELAAQGVSRKVSADMFGMALGAYRKKIRRLREGRTEHGRTLWQAVLEFIQVEGMVTRKKALERFRYDEEDDVAGVLRDLTRSGLVFRSGAGADTVYRAANEDELTGFTKLSKEGLDELVWALLYREPPMLEAELAKKLSRDSIKFEEALSRLVASGRVRRDSEGRVSAVDLMIPLGTKGKWEAGTYDHIQAVVRTICQRLNEYTEPSARGAGASTYTFDVWPGHPLEEEVRKRLSVIRAMLGELGERVSSYNSVAGVPDNYTQVVTYAGQCTFERDLGDTSAAEE